MSYIYLITVCLGSNAVYHFHRLIRNLLIGEHTFEERDGWLKRNKTILWLWVVISGVTGLGLFLYQNILFTRTSLLLFISVVFYVIPFIKLKHKWIKLRDIPFFKVFLVAFIWAMVAVYLPAELAGLKWTLELGLQFMSCMALIFGITLPFDIRDIKTDTSKTFANTLGVKQTILLSCSIMLVWGGIHVFYSIDFLLSIILTFIYSVVLILNTRETSSPFHFAFYLGINTNCIFPFVCLRIQYKILLLGS